MTPRSQSSKLPQAQHKSVAAVLETVGHISRTTLYQAVIALLSTDMRGVIAYAIAVCLTLPPTLAADYSNFIVPSMDEYSRLEYLMNLDLFRRDSKCPNSCSSVGNSQACCPKKTNCALDEAGNIACCPENADCTGTVGPAAGPSTTLPLAGTSTRASAAAITHAITGSSTVANSYYPFPILPTAYANAAECTTSYSSCQLESAKCTGVLEGGGMAVTVSGPGGGITQQGAIAPASAESICSSLSAEACHGLALTQCSTLGGAATAAAGTFVGGSANPAPTRCMVALYGVGMGVAVGLAGQVIG